MYKPADMALWQGRIDQEPEGDLRRWHQAVVPFSPDGGEPGIALLGICCDAGVARNQGRPGARNGPDAIRAALSGQAWHLALPCYDVGNLVCAGNDLEGLQEEQALWVEKLLELEHFPLLLGGGHEIAFGSYLGLLRRLKRRGEAAVIGVINFDAHFDMRKSPQPNSGTSFLQIADLCREEQREFRYFCLGLSQVANTKALFDRARGLGVQWLLDESLTSWDLAHAEARLTDFLAGCDVIYLSIDLDVLPLAVAPGVSAPAARGVPLEVVEHLLTWIRNEAGNRLALADIAEYNPAFDMDGRTAKVAARLCHILARQAEPQSPSSATPGHLLPKGEGIISNPSPSGRGWPKAG
ncbi:MAG TPA: formimidoylglutamase [Desulfuromonadaceae bacterium]